MEVTKRPTNIRMLRVDDQEFKRVRDFKYLAAVVTDDNNTTIEVKQTYIGKPNQPWPKETTEFTILRQTD
jgi:hypothetical protein